MEYIWIEREERGDLYSKMNYHDSYPLSFPEYEFRSFIEQDAQMTHLIATHKSTGSLFVLTLELIADKDE